MLVVANQSGGSQSPVITPFPNRITNQCYHVPRTTAVTIATINDLQGAWMVIPNTVPLTHLTERMNEFFILMVKYHKSNPVVTAIVATLL